MRAIVFNQFSLPRTQGGITRHVDILGAIEDWDFIFVAGDRNYSNQKRFSTDDPRFRLVRVPRYKDRAFARLLSWVAYCIGALKASLFVPRVDVVIGSSPQLFAALVALVYSRARRVPFIFEVRDLWPETFVSMGKIHRGSVLYKLLRAIEVTLVRRADQIVVVTTGWESHFGRIGADLNRYTVVPNVAVAPKPLSEQDRFAVRERYGLSGVTAVFSGSHGPKDGLHEVLDVAAEMPDISFLLLGDGIQKTELISRAKIEGLTNVRFLPHVSKDELNAVLGGCDIGIHCVAPLGIFRQGMSPNKLYDYVAAGLPVVSNAGDSVRRIIGNNPCGVVVESGGLASGLRLVLDAAESEKARWREAGSDLLNSRLSVEHSAKLYSKVLSSALGV